MPYLKLTSVASFDALLGEIRTFLNDTGDWTIIQSLITPDYDVPPPNPEADPPEPDLRAHGRQLRMLQGDCLVCLRSTTAGVGINFLYMLDGHPANSGNSDTMNGNSGLRWDTGIAQEQGANVRNLGQWPGPFPTAHLFTNDPSTYCHVVVEVQAGVYRHLVFGNLVKYGSWTGGGYYGVTNWVEGDNFIDSPSYQSHTVPFDTAEGQSTHGTTVRFVNGVNKWIATAPVTLNGVNRLKMAGHFRGGFGRAFTNLAESPYSGLIALSPVMVGAIRETDNPDTLRWIGYAPDMASVNMQNLAPGAEYTLGSDVWVVFPLCAKNGAEDQFNSGTYGVAYLKHE
jgi:hypothetical protein